ncbi:MAG: hypothetical protein ACOH1I_07625 [Gallionellaceae bacterium]
MNKLIISLLIVSGFYTANSTAEESCASEQCVNAQSIANLPADVTTFIDQRDGCDYFRGEPSPE